MSKYLVALSTETYSDQTAAEAAIEAAGAELLRAFSFGFMFEIEATADQLAAIEGVDLSETSDTVVQAKSAVAYTTSHLDALHALGQSVPWNPQQTGTGQTVYLVDTGVKHFHPEFMSAIIVDLHSNFTTDEDISDFDDEAGHGTAVGSLIVGENIGVAPGAKLVNVKLFNTSQGDITVGEIIAAFDAIAADHSDTPTVAKTICLPWTISKNNFVDAKIGELNGTNLVVVAAAGNDGVDVDSKSPGGVNTIITTGSININGEITSFTNLPASSGETESSVNNYGAEVDIFAVSADISVATLDDSYVAASGTSLAAGIVAGAVALFAERDSTLTATQLKDTLIAEGKIAGGAIVVDESLDVDYSTVNKSIVTADAVGAGQLAEKQSGRIANVKNGVVTTVDIGLNPNATAVDQLSFAPMPTWMSMNDSGEIVVNPDLTADQVPAAYIFAIKGTVGDELIVEEYSIGVYAEVAEELDDSTPNYYYDDETDSYDEVVNYQVAPLIKN